MSRIAQIVKYGWSHSKQLATSHEKKLRLLIFIDMLYCYKKYRMWSNQYLKERFYFRTKEEKICLGKEYAKNGLIRDKWQDEFRRNRKFLAKYTSRKYEIGRKRQIRNKAYQNYFGMGDGCLIEQNVEFSRQHYLNGSIKIGKNILFAKNVFIDYSGEVEIKDNVQLTNGVIIETHHHLFHSDYTRTRDEILPTSLVIEEGAVVGSNAVILSSCHYIGRHARVGAGAVVTKDVPDYTIVVGVPAKVIKYQSD